MLLCLLNYPRCCCCCWYRFEVVNCVLAYTWPWHLCRKLPSFPAWLEFQQLLRMVSRRFWKNQWSCHPFFAYRLEGGTHFVKSYSRLPFVVGEARLGRTPSVRSLDLVCCLVRQQALSRLLWQGCCKLCFSFCDAHPCFLWAISSSSQAIHFSEHAYLALFSQS